MTKGLEDFSGAASHTGHRERLRDRFIEGGATALPDYELLEMVLFRAIKRGDTKPIAKALMARFGTFAEVISAAPERLMEVKGVGPVWRLKSSLFRLLLCALHADKS